MKKLVKVIGVILVELVIVISCISTGVYISSQAEEKETLTINKIALVNLDDGVMIDGAKKYYGTEFITDISDNFEVTGLEHARQGLDSDLYAAYVIIPATFSENVESINAEPCKSNILFKINMNLDVAVRENVIADITEFNNRLSTNIEYVYLDAILKEVHEVQDGANQLLANDLEDLKAVLKFTENDMIVDPEYPERKQVDDEVAQLDLSKEYSEIEAVFALLSNEYKTEEGKAQTEYENLIKDSSSISTQMQMLSTGIEAIGDINAGEEFEIENAQEISDFVTSYNEQFEDWKTDYDNTAVDNFDSYMEDCQEKVDEQILTLTDKQKNQLMTFYETAFAKRSDTEINMKNYDVTCASKEEEDTDKQPLATYKLAEEIITNWENEVINLQDAIGRMQKDLIQANKKIQDLERALAESKKEEGGSASGEELSQLNSKTGSESSLEQGAAGNVKNKYAQYRTDIISALQNDVERIARETEMQKNIKFQESILEWYKAELIFYGIDEKVLEDLEVVDMTSENAKETIELRWEPSISILVECLSENNSEEEKPDNTEQEITEEDTEVTIESASDEIVTQKTITEETSTTEQEVSTEEPTTEESTSDTEEEKEKIKQEKRAEILFKYTYDPQLLDLDSLNIAIGTAVISPISGVLMTEYGDLTAEYTKLSSQWNEWNSKLTAFTIDSYGDEKNKTELEQNFNKNVQSIQKAVGEKGEEYKEYVTKTNEANISNLEAWEESIKDANTKTKANVDANIKSIKENRQAINTDNIALMDDITSALPYSRIGELENKNVYQYITSPIAYEDLSDEKSVENVSEEETVSYIPKEHLFIAIGIVLCIVSGMLLWMSLRKRNKALFSQDLS